MLVSPEVADENDTGAVDDTGAVGTTVVCVPNSGAAGAGLLPPGALSLLLGRKEKPEKGWMDPAVLLPVG